MTNKIYAKPQQHSSKCNSYTSVPMFINTNDLLYGNKKLKYNNTINSSFSPSSFLQYLFSSRSVLCRLLTSLVPPYGQYKTISTDYEGSFLNIILLMLVLYNRLWKFVDEKWFVIISPIIYIGICGLGTRALSLLTKTQITLRELFSLISYGLFGHTLVLLISNLRSELFIPSLIFIGGLSSIRICCVVLLKTTRAPFSFVICTPITITHWLFLLYLELKSS